MQPSASIVVGLGNPGKRYDGTRHNIGFDVVDEVLRQLPGGASAWQEQGGSAVVAKATLAGRSILFIKPQSFMNLSGEPVRELLSFYKRAPEEIVVVHDEIDIPFGCCRLKLGGGDGGHKGIRSLIDCLGTANFARARVGVGRPPNPEWEVSDWVLGKFGPDERSELPTFVKKSAEAVVLLLERGFGPAQNLVNSQKIGL